MEILNLSGINLGDVGMQQIAKAFSYGLEEKVKEEKLKEKMVIGEFIQSGRNNN